MHKLLICDDEPLERIALRKMIERKFSNITILDDAMTGLEAISRVSVHMPDILLIDIKMPEKNGLEAQKQIIDIHPGIKTVIITAYNDFAYAQEAIKYNIFDFLLKPVPPSVLYECLQKIMDSAPAQTGKFRLKNNELPGGNIANAISYIEENFLKGITLADAASEVGLSEKYFSRIFKARTGRTFTDYVNMLRINRAKSFLMHTKSTVYNIARDLNFSDAAYFSKVFYRYEKMTPMQFRRKNTI